MNCSRCHHTNEAHEQSRQSSSLLRAGRCQIPHCTCGQFLDPIPELDEDLL